MSNKYTVRPLRETEYDRWAQFVAHSPSGSIYALPAYLDILCGATGGHFTMCGIFHGDELVGGMPVYLAKSRIGLMAQQRSLLAYHGPVIREYATHVPSERSARQLAGLTALRNYLLTVNCVHMTLSVRHLIPDVRPFLTGGWRAAPNYTYIVDIADLPAAWSRVSQNLRRLIKRAAGRGLSVTDDDDFASFYRLHYDTHKRKKSPLYLPEAAFCAYLARLRAQGWCRLYHARLPDGRAIATQLVLTGPNSIAFTVCAGADEQFQATGANPYLRWQVFEALAGLGYTANDLTGAPYPSTVSRFKSQLGGNPVANWLVTRPLTWRYRLWWRGGATWGRLIRLARKQRRAWIG